MKEYIHYEVLTKAVTASNFSRLHERSSDSERNQLGESKPDFDVDNTVLKVARESHMDHEKKIFLNGSEVAKVEVAKVDVEFYRSYYDDLSEFTDLELRKHWDEYGQGEGRLPTLELYLQRQLDSSAKAKWYLQHIWFYRGVYSDLNNSDLSDYSLVFHYFNEGIKEKRFFLPEDWLNAQGVKDKSLLGQVVDILMSFASPSEKIGRSERLEDAALSMVGLREVPFECYVGNSDRTGKLYVALAVEMLRMGRTDQAKNHLLSAIHFDASSRAFELMGNIFLDAGEVEKAEAYFKESILAEGASEWVYKNLSSLYSRQNKNIAALDVLIKGLSVEPDSKLIGDSFLGCINMYWEETSRLLDGLKGVPDSRQEMLDLAGKRTKKLYSLYSTWFNLRFVNDQKSGIDGWRNNSRKVLIIGDFHLKQCIRYRIDQKVEQLKAQGHQVCTVSWTELDTAKVNMPFFDVVIFYRVPAVNQVVRQIALTKAMGKVAIYEIDDQIFLPNYPESIESYGGSVGFYLYQDLIKGMALTNAAISLCDYSISSTYPLHELLAPLTRAGKGYVHRNGLDSLNWFASKDTASRDSLTLFYGSGTLAHNADFIELAIPAIEKVLQEFPHVRLVIMGHLELPEKFQSRFKSQFRKLPKLSDVTTYSVYLSKADINLAVLHDDQINGAKSELKWFEAACFEIPSILSSTENYRDVIRHGEDAFLAETVDEWYEYLHLLITDEKLRKAIGSNAQERVRQSYSVQELGRGLSKYINELTYVEEEKKKPKICIVNVFFPPQALGGATRVVSDNFDVLLDQYRDKFDICVFTAEANNTQPYNVTAYTYKGVRVYKSSVLFRENMDWHAKDERMYEIFTEFLDLEKPDKVHFHCVQRLTGSIVEAAYDMAIPYIITAHDAWWISDHQFLVDGEGRVYPEGHLDNYHNRVLSNGISFEDSVAREIYLKKLINNAETVLTVSDAFANIYRANGVPNIKVTKNGISSSTKWRNKDTSYTNKVVCGHIGGMSAHKGYYLVKNVMTDLQPENIEMLVVDHSKPSDYESVEYWDKVKVVFLGRQSQSSIVDLYAKIDVLFAPSIWPESYGLVTREAAACGCWVMTSNLGGIGEDIIQGEGGYVFPPTEKDLSIIVKNIDKKPSKFKDSTLTNRLRVVDEQVKELVQYYKVGL